MKSRQTPHANRPTYTEQNDIHAASLISARHTEVVIQNAGHAMQEHGSTILSLSIHHPPLDKVFMKILVPEWTNAQEMLKILSRPFTSRSSAR